MQTKTEDVYVIKLVGLVTRIPKHSILYFFDFSTNFKAFSKFTDLNAIVHVHFSI